MQALKNNFVCVALHIFFLIYHIKAYVCPKNTWNMQIKIYFYLHKHAFIFICLEHANKNPLHFDCRLKRNWLHFRKSGPKKSNIYLSAKSENWRPLMWRVPDWVLEAWPHLTFPRKMTDDQAQAGGAI